MKLIIERDVPVPAPIPFVPVRFFSISVMFALNQNESFKFRRILEVLF